MGDLQQRKKDSGYYSQMHIVGLIANLKGPYFQPSLSVCLSLTGTSTLQCWLILMKLGHKDPTVI